MLIRVLLPNKEEGLFNANCLVAALLDAIKKKHQLPHSEIIDLCTRDGHVKDLPSHLEEIGTPFFSLQKLCLVVRVQDVGSTHPLYTPVLDDYAKNDQFIAALNRNSEAEGEMCVRVKLKNRPPVYKPRPPESPSKLKSADRSKTRARKSKEYRKH